MPPIDLTTTNLGSQADQQRKTDSESNTRINALVGYCDGDYGAREARQALANADAGTAGGGGTPATTIASGIDMSADIDAILLSTQNTEAGVGDPTDALATAPLTGSFSLVALIKSVLAGIGFGTDTAGNDTVLGKLKEIALAVTSTGGTAIVDTNFTATGTAAIASAANTSTIELTVQNKDLVEYAYIRANGTATTSLSITLAPLGSVRFTGFEAQQAISAISDGANVELYIKRVNS